MQSIKINGFDTYEDFGLMPSKNLIVASPKTKPVYIDAYRIDGPIDMSEALNGQMLYANRTGNWNFISSRRVSNPKTELHRLLNLYHGKRVRVELSDEPEYYYSGRIEITQDDIHKGLYKITIQYTLEPYKYELTETAEDWLWDTFNFETGIIREYGGMVVDGTLDVTIIGSSRLVIPVITASNAMTVTYDGVTYGLAQGNNYIPQIMIGEGEHELTFSGSGTISVNFRGGWL